MSNRADRDLLGDILEALRRARSYMAGQSYEQFLADTKTQDAVIRTLEILGEATKKLSPSLRESHPEIPWKSMAGVHRLANRPRPASGAGGAGDGRSRGRATGVRTACWLGVPLESPSPGV
jgi:hypothetical protein